MYARFCVQEMSRNRLSYEDWLKEFNAINKEKHAKEAKLAELEQAEEARASRYALQNACVQTAFFMDSGSKLTQIFQSSAWLAGTVVALAAS